MTGLAVALPALALATPAIAQVDPVDLPPLPAPVNAEPAAVETALPADLPRPTFETETIVGADGVETITRTRRIERPAALPQTAEGAPYPGGPVAFAPLALDREQWIDECRRRIDGRSRKKRDRYDCEAALDGYLAQPNATFASRTIPAPGYAYPAYGYAPAYTGQYAYSAGCGCQQPQVAWVPVQTQQRQRVIVRETVREELVPGTRIIPPAPRPIKGPAPLPIKGTAPRPVKMIKQ